jgi:hypothetical protein
MDTTRGQFLGSSEQQRDCGGLGQRDLRTEVGQRPQQAGTVACTRCMRSMGKLTGLTSPSAFIIDGGKSVLNQSFAIIEPGTSWYTAGIKTDCVLHARHSTARHDTHGDQSITGIRASQHQSMHPFLSRPDRTGLERYAMQTQ